MLVGQDWVSPTEFWKLSPGQVWWIIEAKTPPEKQQRADGLDHAYRMLKEAKAKEAVQ